MEKTILISIPIEDFQTVIIDCVNSCLRNNKFLIQEQNHDSPIWFDLTQFCNYHPDRPTKATVYGWVNEGTVPVHKGAKKLRFLKSEIDIWLSQGRRKTNSEIALDATNYLNKKRG